MGHGMALNLLSEGHEVSVIAHRNRAPIDDLVSRGAREAASFETLGEDAQAIVLCLTGTSVVESVCGQLLPYLGDGVLVLDTTTNEPGGPERLAARLAQSGVRYAEAPLTGGATQARDGELGAIVGCSEDDFADAQRLLGSFCKDMARFGEVGMGIRAKLVSNFLALGTATLVVESFKQARSLGVDWEKLYRLALLGSGNSTGLQRIIGGALEGNYRGYLFSVANTAKDFAYFRQLAASNHDVPELAEVMHRMYQEALKNGLGECMISETLLEAGPPQEPR